jgi:predicted branched-subunit amino acid permease
MQESHPQAVNTEPTPTFTWAGVKRGIAIALPFGASSIIYGLGFGVLASQVGLSVLEAVIMSALVFSGTAQFAILQSWSAGLALLPVFATVMLANARYILMGAALRPWFASLRQGRVTLTLLTVVDGSFAIGMRERAAGRNDAGVVFGAGLISYVAWVAATGLGFALGQLVPDPKVYALDFIIVAFCASSAALMWRGKSDLAPAAIALAAAILVNLVAPGPWVVVAAAVAGVIVGALRHDRNA